MEEVGKLPHYITEQIGEHETIVFWTRRATFEIVSEIGQSIFWLIIYSLFVIDMAENLGWDGLLWLLLFDIAIAWYGAWEVLQWRSGVHVVTEFDHQSGGMYRPFWGAFSIKHKDIAIDRASPDVSHDRPWHVRLWGWITGERMEKVTITSQSKSYLTGNKVPLGLSKSISKVRGSPASSDLESSPSVVQMSRELRAIKDSKSLPEWQATHYLSSLWEGSIGRHD